MDTLELIAFNRWYLIFFSIFYCFLVTNLTKNNKKAKWFKYYSIILQSLFIIFYFYMAFQLASMNSSNYDFFTYGLSLFYILSYVPFLSLIVLNFQSSKSSVLIKIAKMLMCLLIGIILYYPYMLLTYGFAP